MSLRKCNECGHNISTKALECPECGSPISLEEDVQKDNTVFKIKKLSSHPISIITTIMLFISLIAVVSSNLIFLNTIRGNLTLQQATTSTYYSDYVNLYPTLILNIACIAAILSCLSKRLKIISKIGYLTNIIISIILFFNLYSNNLRVGISYFIIVLINTILFIIPIKYRIVEEEIVIEKKKWEVELHRV